MFRVAVSPERLAWTPETFWRSTAAEMNMALEGLAGNFGSSPVISRDEIRRLAAEYGERPSLRAHPNATIVGATP
ncbi:phage tail assembly chaperone [Shinella sp. M31]|uniref:phage tail assembly chaperone n=1 Tax=Shinella sp. M31 TaxID=3368615 RepID=UPI003BA038B7